MSHLSKRAAAVEAAAIQAMTDEQLAALAANENPAVAELIRSLSDAELRAIASGNASPQLINRIHR
jgi:hypothetical protein